MTTPHLLSADESAAVRLFVYPFHAAPTADLVDLFAGLFAAGTTQAYAFDFLFDLEYTGSPFTGYYKGVSDSSFCATLVDNLCYGTDISAATRAAWADFVESRLAVHPSRGSMTAELVAAIDAYSGSDADLVALKAELADRTTTAVTFSQSAAGQTYDSAGWQQLLDPLAPPPPEPTFDLTVSAESVNEGSSVTFTLTTTHVDAGTNIAFSLAGTGITAADIVGGSTGGTFHVGADGRAQAQFQLTADASTEGNETLRLEMEQGLGAISVLVKDTSTTPPPVPTYALSASASEVDEGASLTFTLTTTHVAAGTEIAFTLLGTGIEIADLANGSLFGSFIVGADGTATQQRTLVADTRTEGNEVLTLKLNGRSESVSVTVKDTSLTPEPVSDETVVVADDLNNSRAGPPETPAEGEIRIETYLTYDLLDQSGSGAERMTLAELRAGGSAGAALITTNSSADRGNIPQVSNQDLVTYDLGLGTDRVDYSAESGKIIAVIGSDSIADERLHVIVNDDETDNDLNDAHDRIDTLEQVEEIVAAEGGGVLDLTDSGQDWLITFSWNFDAVDDVVASKDRAVHRVRLADLDSGNAISTGYLEYRDAGTSGTVTQATAAWTGVQGSDHDETLQFTADESTDQRLDELRGGDNVVEYGRLMSSILLSVEIDPWADSTDAADDTNATGITTATASFTTGDGITLLSGATHVTRAYTPDNEVAAGTLHVTGSQDHEDAIDFDATALAKAFTMGKVGTSLVLVQLLDVQDTTAFSFSGFDLLQDNGVTDDLYIAVNIHDAIDDAPDLIDDAGDDHDAIRIFDQARGNDAVGGNDDEIHLDVINGSAEGFDFDFDVLDLSAFTETGLDVDGTAGSDDELVLGTLASLDAVTRFEALVLSEASTDEGTLLTLDLDADRVTGAGGSLFSYTGSVLSAGGTVFGSADQASPVPAMDTAMHLNVLDTTPGAGATVWGGNGDDTIDGGLGDDVIRGGGGDDTLDGGSAAERWTFGLGGVPDSNAANRLLLTLTIDGVVLTLGEAAVADTSYGDGNGAVVDGASSSVIGAALAALVQANRTAINAGPGSGTLDSATFTSGELRLFFDSGINANDVVTLNLAANGDSGTFVLSAGVNVNGGSGADRFEFEASGAANGSDIVQKFGAGSDKLDVTAFTGTAITSAASAINAVNGGAFSGLANRAEFIFNKAGGTLAISDFATVAAAAKFVMPDGAHQVVAVTADPTGSNGNDANTPVFLYFVDNGATAGLSDLTVSLVGTISSDTELTLDDIYDALG